MSATVGVASPATGAAVDARRSVDTEPETRNPTLVGGRPTAPNRAYPRRLEIEIKPPSPYRLPRYAGQDGTLQLRAGIASRYFEIEGAPILVRAWQPALDRVHLRVDDLTGVHTPGRPLKRSSLPGWRAETRSGRIQADRPPAGPEQLEQAAARMRFALAVDDDLTDFYRRFRRDRLIGRLIHLRPYLRPNRLTTPWDALAWAIVGQLIEARRASLITRRIVRRWGRPGPDGLTDTPTAQAIADRAPAELESCDLAGRRAIAMRIAARETVAGRIDPGDPAGDERLLKVPQIGPWTVQCLGLFGRGEPDSLPAGDLDYLKLIGRLACMGRRAEVAEVEEFFEPYRPYRGLAGDLLRQAARGLPM